MFCPAIGTTPLGKRPGRQLNRFMLYFTYFYICCTSAEGIVNLKWNIEEGMEWS